MRKWIDLLGSEVIKSEHRTAQVVMTEITEAEARSLTEMKALIESTQIDEGNDDNDHMPPKYDPGDDDHYDALDKTGFFGQQGAGCLVMAQKTGRMMLVLRSSDVLEPGTWGNIGGAHHGNEQPVKATERELFEETGYAGPVHMIPLFVFRKGTFTYRNFLALVPDEFEPELGWEADDHVWVDIGDWPEPLHFGPMAVFNDAASMATIEHYAKLSRD